MMDGRSLHRLAYASMAVLAPAVAACTLLRPLDYLTNGADASAADAALAEAGDVRADTFQALDAGDAAADAGPDAVPDARPSGTWCVLAQPAAFLCIDFDEGNLTTAYQAGMLVTLPSPAVDPGGDASVGAMASSPPGDFLAYAPATTGDGGSLAVRYEQPVDVPAPATAARLRFDGQLRTYTPGEELDVASLYMYPGDGGTPVRLFLGISPSGQGSFFLDTGTTSEGQPFSFPADGQWHTFELAMTLSPKLLANLYMDNRDASVTAVTDLTVPFTTAQPTNFYLGAEPYAPSAPVLMAFDNVVLTAQ